jgi:hypothetical protein
MLRCAKGRSVPLLRYFVVVAGVLLAMLAVVNWCAPSPPPAASHEASVDKSTLHIRSDHKWPQKIEFDTAMQPFTAPSMPTAAIATPVAVPGPPEKPALDALAQAKPSEPQIAKPKPRVRTARRAPRSAPRTVVAVNPAPQPGLFGWGEPALGPQRPSADTRTSSHNGWFGERNRENIVSWGSGGASDW